MRRSFFHRSEDCYTEIDDAYNNGELECTTDLEECPPSCNEIVYSASLSSALWPSSIKQSDVEEAVIEKVPTAETEMNCRGAGWIGRNVLRLDVFFETFTYQQVVTAASYTVVFLAP